MKNPIKIFHLVYIPVALALISIAVYYERFAHFSKEGNFSKDINISLPEYTIAEKQMIEPMDVWTWESYDSLSYKLTLSEPISKAKCKTITSERRGWQHVEGNKYKRYKDIIGEDLWCTYEIGSDSIQIEYRYNYYNNCTLTIVTSLLLLFIYCILLIIVCIIRFIQVRKHK